MWSPEITKTDQPLFLQIADAVIRDVRRGQLREGDRLPSTRLVARQLGVNRNTVTAAWRELSSQGWIESHPRGTTRIASRIQALSPARFEHSRAGFPVARQVPPPLVTPTAGALTLAGGRPDLRHFPVDAFARAWRTALRHSRGRLLEYGDPQGHGGLRQALGAFLTGERGLRTQADGIVVTRGSQQALYLLSMALLRPGDRVAVERLGYPPAWEAFRASGAVLVPIDVDAEGMVVEQVADEASKGGLRMVYCTPHHQFPSMVTMSAPRRLALIEVARRHQIAVIEDDYDNEFHFHGRPVAPLASHDRHGVVLYVGTLSKVLAPGLRLGFLVAPREVIDAVISRRIGIDRQGDSATEAALALLFEDGTVGRHLRKMRRIYANRQLAAIEALNIHLKGRVQFERPAGGLALWVTTGGVDPQRWQSEARALGVDFEIGRHYSLLSEDLPNLRVGFAALDEDEIDEAIARLASAREKVSSTSH